MENVDGLPKGTLDQFHKHRTRIYKHLYYCYRCVRTFDTKEPTETCKFCGAAVRDITGAKFESPFAQKYRYYCTRCEKNFESFTIFENCAICGSKIMHIYKWEELNTLEKLSVRLKRMISPGTRSERNGNSKKPLFGERKKSSNAEEMPSR